MITVSIIEIALPIIFAGVALVLGLTMCTLAAVALIKYIKK